MIMFFNLFKVLQSVLSVILMEVFYVAYLQRKENIWCESLPIASIHSWDQFTTKFFHKFNSYHYEHVCTELGNLRKNENESTTYFRIRFKLICVRFKSKDRPS